MSLRDFEAKRVLVTGASSGLGWELARQLCRRGAHVVAIARRKDLLERLRKTILEESPTAVIEIEVCDITNRETVQRLLGTRVFDIAILNAGAKEQCEGGFLVEKALQNFEVNVRGTLFCLDPILKQMTKRREGRIAFISSLGGRHGMVGSQGYNASKAALSNLATSLRMDLDLLKIPVGITLVEPGLIRTGMTAKSGLSSRLGISPLAAAKTIIDGLSRSRDKIVFPTLMRALTAVASNAPFSLQRKIFGAAKR